MARQYKITKATYNRLVGVIFEYAIIDDVKAPKWFSEFVEKQFKPEITNIKTRLERVESRLDNLVKKNNLVE